MKTVVRILLIGWLCGWMNHPCAAAQDKAADSTFNFLLTQPKDTNLVKSLNSLGIQYEFSDSAFAEKVYLQALSISRQLKNPRLGEGGSLFVELVLV